MNNFYVDEQIGLTTLNTNDSLSLPSGAEVDIKAKVDSEAAWTIVNYIAKCWLVSGDHEGQAIMASINKQGSIRSTLRFMLTSNGWVNKGRQFAGIYNIHQAYVRGRRGIILAIQRDGCCHLISVVYGRMSKLQSIYSIVNVDEVEDKSLRIVASVVATDNKGEFIAGGVNWTKRICLKLK